MRVLIVDDERPARDRLRRLLAAAPDVSAVAEARDGFEALDAVAAFRPDVLFLDIEMPEVTGLEVAASLPAPAPLIVFVTAYDAYAVRAFDANAIDYLLKPCDADRLARTLARVRRRLGDARTPSSTGHPLRQLLVAERGVTRVVRVADIVWLATADNYVELHTAAGVPLLRQTLSALLATLGPGFQRVHRRAAVRLDCVESVVVNDKGDGEVLLRGGARAPVSRQYRAALMAALHAPE